MHNFLWGEISSFVRFVEGVIRGLVYEGQLGIYGVLECAFIGIYLKLLLWNWFLIEIVLVGRLLLEGHINNGRVEGRLDDQ